MTVPVVPTVTVEEFRASMPVFDDETAYNYDELFFWLTFADQVLTPDKWPEPYRSLGIRLFVAHNIILARRDDVTVLGGGIPGGTLGVVASKSVGGASISYNTMIGLEQGAGAWNLTVYGLRFYRIMMLVGMGGVQLGGPDIALDDTFGAAWPGVLYPR